VTGSIPAAGANVVRSPRRLGDGVRPRSGESGGGEALPTLLGGLTPVDPFFSGEDEGMGIGFEVGPVEPLFDAIVDVDGIGGRPPLPSPFKILRVSWRR
jgi:hypothetical protein